jgi:sulfate adenylyltransferase subunit 1
MDILRFIVAGSVDNGKSTLIGRLLYDTKSIPDDQLLVFNEQTENKNIFLGLASFTDGLRAEREQGITIDVAYKYFTTSRRKFIIIDAPGHVQYTRNMITGASNASLSIILIDARYGITQQTRRHTIIASILKIPNIIVAINKMDLVDFSEIRYNLVCEEFEQIAKSLNLSVHSFIPVSALHGYNITSLSSNISWYKGKSLLSLLENVKLDEKLNLPSRFSVQYVIRKRTEQFDDYRGYAGKVIGGTYSIGDSVVVLPSGIESTISSIKINGIENNLAFAPQNAVLELKDKLDISRGDLIVKPDERPKLKNRFEALIIWMGNKPLILNEKYLLQINSILTICIISEIEYILDPDSLLKKHSAIEVTLNEISRVLIRTSSFIALDTFSTLKENGCGILIDQTSFLTVGACIIE